MEGLQVGLGVEPGCLNREAVTGNGWDHLVAALGTAGRYQETWVPLSGEGPPTTIYYGDRMDTLRLQCPLEGFAPFLSGLEF